MTLVNTKTGRSYTQSATNRWLFLPGGMETGVYKLSVTLKDAKELDKEIIVIITLLIKKKLIL